MPKSFEPIAAAFDPAAGFTREHAERSIAFLIDQPWMACRRCRRLSNAR
jgi:hypothetical protein